MAEISIGRFDKLTSFKFNRKSNKSRLWSVNPNTITIKKFVPISFDGKNILFNKTIYTIKEFSKVTIEKKLNSLIVLTCNEKVLLLENGANFAYNITVLEVNFPFFQKVKFNSNLEKNLSTLNKCLFKISKFGIKGNSLADDTITNGMYKIERKLRFKSSLDRNFAFLTMAGYQEVFKLKEEREGRAVIALDFNSMFASCMKGDFLDPKSLEYKKYNLNLDSTPLNTGLYRVTLLNPKTEHILKHHPFKYTCINRSNTFKLSYNDSIEALLFDNEIEYYRNHFEKIHINDGIISKKTIPHPLYRLAKRLYSKRLSAHLSGNKELASLLKFKLAMLHSSSAKSKIKEIEFNNVKDLQDFIEDEFFISSRGEIGNLELINCLNDSNNFMIRTQKNKIKFKYQDFNNPGNLFSLSAKILANARLEMTKTIELINKFDDIEICYANIDSIHVSIPRTEMQRFLTYMEALISTELGDLKIQTVADRGYWLDIGKYWLIKNNKVEKFANSGFNPFGNENPCINRSKKLIRYKLNQFQFYKPYYSNIYTSFSSKKRLVTECDGEATNYERFSFGQINNLNSMLKTESVEAITSTTKKVDIFNTISTIANYGSN